MSPFLRRRPSRVQITPSRSSTRPASMRGSCGAIHRPFTRTNVGRFVVEKKPSGRTPSAGAGANRASGKVVNGGWVKSGGGKFDTHWNVAGRGAGLQVDE